MRDPHQNIFFYYRGPSKRDKESLYDFQVEDNTTKGLVNIFEFCCQAGFVDLLSGFLKAIEAPNRPVVSFKLQKGLSGSRPDALIDLADYNIHIESKVRARLDLDQIRRHLSDIGAKDVLVVITNNLDDKSSLNSISDNRVRYLSWSKVHKICRRTVEKIKGNKSLSAVAQLIEQFIDYMEVVVMTEFNGFKDSDFDFWIDPNPYYVPILRKKLKALANIIKEKLPKEIGSEYSFIKPGNISRSGKDERFAWVAIKRPKDGKDVFNQCNFTIEVSKSCLDINTVVRNGRTSQSKTPIGIFFNRISTNTNKFLQVISGARKESRLVVSKRLPRTGKRIMPGNEKWVKFFEMKLSDINTQKDVQYICDVLKKADKEPGAPGIHFRYSIDRGTKVLTESVELEGEIISTIKKFKPVLDFLKEKEV
ncbi:MAG: hypothetical protein K9L86_04770 [Candidatus Omnitrophica bacterium]|nr:hypothetical protein [Candidatus Omnitrophota bacterium]